MPRTKGAKNKDKPLAYYLKKVEELGGKIPENTPAKKAKKEIENITEKAKAAFSLDKPKEVKPPVDGAPPVDLSGTVIRCGNPACNKILDKEYTRCPFCGCNLTWQ